MEEKEKTRLERYKNGTPEQQDLYGSDSFGAILYTTFTKLQLPESKYRSFVDIFGDVILQLVAPDTVHTALIAYLGITPAQATEVIETIVKGV